MFGQSFLLLCFPVVQSFLLFALMQKVEQKDQGKPQRSAGFAGPRTTVTQSLSETFPAVFRLSLKL
jgi:membrane protein implicated in regulation of membrane protease activity